MSTVLCPECRADLIHDRGYLPTHEANVIRGQLATGSVICPMSNTKVVTECLMMTYSATCPDCDSLTELTLTEDYPGSFDHIKAFLELECLVCSTQEGYYCSNEDCGVLVKEKVHHWVVEVDVLAVPSNFTSLADATEYANRFPPDSTGITEHPAGWYDMDGDTEYENADGATWCPASTDESTPVHIGAFKPKHAKILLASDGHTIHEEPDESDATADTNERNRHGNN